MLRTVRRSDAPDSLFESRAFFYFLPMTKKTPIQNIKSALSGLFATPQNKRGVALVNPPDWFTEFVASGSYAGENFSVEGSLRVMAVLSAFTILSEDIASLPLILYRRLERGKERATSHPYYTLLHDAPNPEMTSMVFREMMIGHLLGWGNFFAQMIWDGRGVVRELWPLAPNRMTVFREDGERKYLYLTETGKKIAFRQEDILHIPAFGFDGLVGYSRISMARNAIGLSIAAEKYGSKMFANDARPSVLFKAGKPMTKEAKQALRESWNQLYRGAGNAARSAVLEDGIDLETIGFPPEDAQFLQTRSFQVQEIARAFRIPPHMLADIDRSTSWGSGIEQQEISYLNHTLRPWITRVEQQLTKDLLLGRERRSYLIEHLTDAMLRTDTEARMNAYVQAITNGIMSRNEVRERENLNPYDGGDDFLIPLNMTTSVEDIPGDADPETEPAPVRDLTPIMVDAARRVLTREAHEVRDASRRWLVKKDDPAKFEHWLEQFYKQDHPQYLRAVFSPYIEAGLLGQRQLAHIAVAHSETQGHRVAQALAEHADLEEITEAWPLGAHVLAQALMDEELNHD